MNVTDIFEKLHLEQSAASQRLAILCMADIVTTQRVGKEIFYTLNSNRIEQVALFVHKIAFD